MNTTTCQNCGNVNKSTNTRCTSCGELLTNTVQKSKISKNKLVIILNIFLIVSLGPFIFVGIVFTVVGETSIKSDNEKSKNYLETMATFVEISDDCIINEEGRFCKAIYEYKVNGDIFKGSPNFRGSGDVFDKTIKVKYNPNNPKEYVMDAGWSTFSKIGKGLIIGPIIIFIVFEIFIIVFKVKYKHKRFTNE